ncbi:MAG: class I SAM-dependent methyltransferase [Acidimicrobiales bacterium]|jgi:predicted O-methyltransferase YrrM
MFNDLDADVLEVMRELEARDERDRDDGTPHLERLRQITPDTGRFISLWAASAPAGAWIEVGTSAGYSALWLAQAARVSGRTLTTYEILPEKARLARETFARARATDVVHLVEGDFLDHADEVEDVAFCFLDAEKDVYEPCYEVLVPKMVPGAILIADNFTSHRDELQTMLERVLDDGRVDAMVATVGKGELVCRRR